MHTSLTQALSDGFKLVDDLKITEAVSLADELLQLHKDQDSTAAILNFKGEALLFAEHYPLASSCFFESMKLAGESGNITALAEACCGMSYVYRFVEDYRAAIHYARRTKELLQQTQVNTTYIKALISEGISYARLENFEEADLVLHKALRFAETLNSSYFTATCIKSLADMYLAKKEHVQAVRLYEKALPYAEEKDHFVLRSMILVRLAEACEQGNNIDKAITAAFMGLDEALKNQFAAGEKSAHQILSRLFERNHDTEKAYQHLKAYLNLQTGSHAIKQNHKINKMELAFMKEAKDKEIYLLEQVKEKHKAITASIAYAKGVQEAILPLSGLTGDPVLDYFIFFKPKEKVGGDFYWIQRTERGFLFCVADCTGHGVPGAMLTMLGSNLVSQSYQQHKTSGLNAMLSEINTALHATFGNSNNLVTANDGMDIGLCSIEKNKAGNEWILSFSGANHAAILVRGHEVVQTAYNRSGISLLTAAGYQFSQTEYPLKAGDNIYLFSDGYPDQFGGITTESRDAGGKKFKHRQLIGLLQNISTENVKTQKEILQQSLHNWMGELEQVDDICVLGIQFKGG